ncbi:MAG: hypothetical protein IPJ00_11280 [Saprospirales bacterium]|nr:hypothetical protein [Saprospirales bacterium]
MNFEELIEEFTSLSKSNTQSLEGFHSKLLSLKEKIEAETPEFQVVKKKDGILGTFLGKIKYKISNVYVLFLVLIMAFMIVSVFFYQFIMKELLE